MWRTYSYILQANTCQTVPSILEAAGSEFERGRKGQGTDRKIIVILENSIISLSQTHTQLVNLWLPDKNRPVMQSINQSINNFI